MRVPQQFRPQEIVVPCEFYRGSDLVQIEVTVYLGIDEIEIDLDKHDLSDAERKYVETHCERVAVDEAHERDDNARADAAEATAEWRRERFWTDPDWSNILP